MDCIYDEYRVIWEMCEEKDVSSVLESFFCESF